MTFPQPWKLFAAGALRLHPPALRKRDPTLFGGWTRPCNTARLYHRKTRNYQRNLETSSSRRRTAQLTAKHVELEQSYDDTLGGPLGSALDLKECRKTEGHCQRVTAFCCISIARSMPVPDPYLPILARARFPPRYRQQDGLFQTVSCANPGRLDDAEKKKEKMRETLRNRLQHADSHPVSCVTRQKIVLAHQEFFDGSGYPRGLKGEQIPLGARIFTIADSLDAS